MAEYTGYFDFEIKAAGDDETTPRDRVHKLWRGGLITQNEGRRDLEYDPVEGGDVFYAPASFVPLADPGVTDDDE